jgi:rubredoxin
MPISAGTSQLFIVLNSIPRRVGNRAVNSLTGFPVNSLPPGSTVWGALPVNWNVPVSQVDDGHGLHEPAAAAS